MMGLKENINKYEQVYVAYGSSSKTCHFVHVFFYKLRLFADFVCKKRRKKKNFRLWL